MTEYLNFSKYHTAEEAREVSELFTQENIPNILEHEVNQLDKIYIGESLDPYFVIRIPAACFDKANTVLINHAKKQLDNINPDYYLFGFSNEELQEVTRNPDEWNHFDQALALKLLADRNIAVPVKVQLAEVKEYIPYRLQLPWIILGYVLAILFNLAGITIGIITMVAYRTLQNGQRVPMYDRYTRLHAKIMMGIGLVRLMFFVIFLLMLR